jgi:NAD-dependent SIR2 family protein deacetylase
MTSTAVRVCAAGPGRVTLLVDGATLAAEAGVPPRPSGLTWEAYGPRMHAIHAADPGPGHLAARRLQDSGRLDGVITDGDDALLQEAGVREVVELAGSVALSVCPACGYNEPLACLLELLPHPRCAACGGLLRPDVDEPGAPPRPEAAARARALVARARLLLVAGAPAAGSVLAELTADATAEVVAVRDGSQLAAVADALEAAGRDQSMGYGRAR